MTDPLSPHLTDDFLNEYLDEALAPAPQSQAASHLAACTHSPARLPDLPALFAEPDALPDATLTHDLAPGVLRATHPSPAVQAPTPAPRHPLYRIVFPLQALAAVVLLASSGH